MKNLTVLISSIFLALPGFCKDETVSFGNKVWFVVGDLRDRHAVAAETCIKTQLELQSRIQELEAELAINTLSSVLNVRTQVQQNPAFPQAHSNSFYCAVEVTSSNSSVVLRLARLKEKLPKGTPEGTCEGEFSEAIYSERNWLYVATRESRALFSRKLICEASYLEVQMPGLVGTR